MSPMTQDPARKEAVFTGPLPGLGKLSPALRDDSQDSSHISHFFLAAKF